MTGIQFLDADGNELIDPEIVLATSPRPPRASWPHRWRERTGLAAAGPVARHTAVALAIAAPVLWLAAAALAVVAPFKGVYSERIQSDVLYVQSMDGWGRLTGLQDSTTSGEHGTRYGVLMCICAAVLVVAAVLHALGLRASSAVALAAAMALGGCVATIWLEVYTDFDRIRAAFAQPATPAPRTFELKYGPLFWLSGAATVIGTAGCLIVIVARRTLPAPPSGLAPVADEAHLTDGAGDGPASDELLPQVFG